MSEVRDGLEVPIFHVELKTGPGAIDTMKEFQLDVNDSNDIAGAVNHTRLPAGDDCVRSQSGRGDVLAVASGPRGHARALR